MERQIGSRKLLSVVEKGVLGFERKDDGRDTWPLSFILIILIGRIRSCFEIMKHNEWDVSFVTLYIHQSALLLNDEALDHDDSFELSLGGFLFEGSRASIWFLRKRNF